jgi:hypothetical protein
MDGDRWAGDDRGAALVEFIVIGVGVLIPLAYVVIAVAQVIGAHAAAQQAVREAGRVFVRDTAVQSGEWRAREAATIAFDDRGLSVPAEALSITCPGTCLTPGSSVAVELAWDMPLPWMPAGLDSWVTVPIRASGEYEVDEFRPAGV